MSTNDGFQLLLIFQHQIFSIRRITIFFAHVLVVASTPCEAVLHSRPLKLLDQHHLCAHSHKRPQQQITKRHKQNTYIIMQTHSNIKCKSSINQNATTKPIPGADADALLSGRSPINLSMMLTFINVLPSPPDASPIGSFKNLQTSTTEGFPCLLVLCNNFFNWD